MIYNNFLHILYHLTKNMQNIFKKFLKYDIFLLVILRKDLFMNKKTKKILVWIMLILMIASVVASILAYALR